MNELKITPAELEVIENMISYYKHIPAADLVTRRPGFVADDLEKLLTVVNTIINR